jgi:hypothetical protein
MIGSAVSPLERKRLHRVERKGNYVRIGENSRTPIEALHPTCQNRSKTTGISNCVIHTHATLAALFGLPFMCDGR